MRFLFVVALALGPARALADIFACEPPDAIFIQYQRTPCAEGDRIETVTPDTADPAHDPVLQRADDFYRHHVLGDTPIEAEAWYTSETIASGWLVDVPSAVENGSAFAEKHGGIEAIEFAITGSLDGLVAANVFVEFADGKIDKQRSCWLLEGDQWKMHMSCLEIALRADDVTEEDKEALRALEALIKNEP